MDVTRRATIGGRAGVRPGATYRLDDDHMIYVLESDPSISELPIAAVGKRRQFVSEKGVEGDLTGLERN